MTFSVGRPTGKPDAKGLVWCRAFKMPAELNVALRRIAVNRGARGYVATLQALLMEHPDVKREVRAVKRRKKREAS